MTPADDFVPGVEIGLDLDRHRCSERRMRHLICARPLHADRTSIGRFGEQHRVERDIISGVVAIAAGALEMLDRNVVDRQFKYERKVGAQKINALAVRPDMDVVGVPLRDRAGRRDRGMGDIGAGEPSAQRAGLFACIRRDLGLDDRRFDRLRL